MAMTLRLSAQQTESLRMAAEREGISMQAAALRAVDEYTQKRARGRSELLARIVEENREVLERLRDS
ncbi:MULTISPECIES: hypothetical protein [Brevibacterium]|nr:hypothetical protein [Brevibacterium sp.]